MQQVFSIFFTIFFFCQCSFSAFSEYSGKSTKKGMISKTKNRQKSISDAYNLIERVIDPNSPMCKYAVKNDIAAIKRMLLRSKNIKADVNTICKHNESLFLIAVKNDNYLVAEFLFRKGANVNIQNEAGVSALHIIAQKKSENADRIFNFLIKSKRLNVNLKDIEGYTPLMRAVEFEKIPMISALVEANSDLNVKNNYGHNVFDLANMSLDGKKTDKEKEISNNIINILNKNE